VNLTVTEPTPPRGGLFVAFEGGEGGGKSTQAARLQAYCEGRGRAVVRTREPGGTPVGAAIRALLLDPSTGVLDDRTEALLYAADRAEHVATVIAPALRRGGLVISDRYIDSSLAYQGAGRALAVDEVEAVSAWATGGLLPDLTVLLDLDPERGLARFSGADRLEAEGLAFHQRVRRAFLELAARDPERYLVIDATADADVVEQRIRDRVGPLLDLLPETAHER
jgi:dTMP kinase